MCTACTCATASADETISGETDPQVEVVGRYAVTGMTCGHCAGSVTEQIQLIEGVHDVAVDLATGQVTVTADRSVPADAVRSAVREAGYHLA